MEEDPVLGVKETPVLLPTITDEIRLWELEHERLRFSDGVLYNQFISQVDFELLRNHARDLGMLVFENLAKRLMVVMPASHSDWLLEEAEAELLRGPRARP